MHKFKIVGGKRLKSSGLRADPRRRWTVYYLGQKVKTSWSWVGAMRWTVEKIK